MGHSNRYRQQQADGPHVVHEGREERRNAGQRGHPEGQVLRYAGIPIGYHVHYAGIVEGPAQNQHRGDRDHRRVSEPLVSLCRRHDARDCQHQQGHNGDNVVTPLADYEQHEGQDEDSEYYNFVHLSLRLRELADAVVALPAGVIYNGFRRKVNTRDGASMGRNRRE